MNKEDIEYLLSILLCPISGVALKYDEKNHYLVTIDDKIAYPIKDDIPIMLESAALYPENKSDNK